MAVLEVTVVRGGHARWRAKRTACTVAAARVFDLLETARALITRQLTEQQSILQDLGAS